MSNFLGGITMAFNPTALQPPTQKPKPVILLLDVSGSMKGSKIETLNDAVKTMIDVFCKEMESSETLVYQVAIFTFGELIELHTPYTPVDELKAKGISHFQARGGTPLGYVLKQAKSMIEDKNVTKGMKVPAVILVSDGRPDPPSSHDDWHEDLKAFIDDGRSSKSERYGIPIGRDADRSVMEQFASKENIYEAENAEDIVKAFKMVSMSVSTKARASSVASVPKADVSMDGRPASKPVTSNSNNSGDDDGGLEW